MEPGPDEPTPSRSGPGDPVRFRLGASPSLGRLLTALHVGAGLCLCRCDIPPVLVALGLASIAAHLLASARAHAHRSTPRAVVELVRTDRARWRAMTRAGTVLAGEVAPGSLVIPGLVLLGLRSDDGTRLRVIVPSDALGAEQFRRLRVALREAADPGP